MELTKTQAEALQELASRQRLKSTSVVVKEADIDFLLAKGLIVSIKQENFPVYRPSILGWEYLEKK